MNRSATLPPPSLLKHEISLIAAATANPVPLFLTGLLSMWAGVHTGQNPQLTLTYSLFAYLLSLLAIIDLRHMVIPHLLTGLLSALGLALAPTLGLSLTGALIGGAVAFGGLFTCAFITEALTRKLALGGGDLWLILALGIWLGAGGLPMLLVAAAVTGIFSVLIHRWLTQGMLTMAGNPQFPFGPALCAAGWLALLYAPAYWHAVAYVAGS